MILVAAGFCGWLQGRTSLLPALQQHASPGGATISCHAGLPGNTGLGQCIQGRLILLHFHAQLHALLSDYVVSLGMSVIYQSMVVHIYAGLPGNITQGQCLQGMQMLHDFHAQQLRALLSDCVVSFGTDVMH